jgi:hypothetical protein
MCAGCSTAARVKGTFGYGNIAPDLTALFPRGGKAGAEPT